MTSWRFKKWYQLIRPFVDHHRPSHHHPNPLCQFVLQNCHPVHTLFLCCTISRFLEDITVDNRDNVVRTMRSKSIESPTSWRFWIPSGCIVQRVIRVNHVVSVVASGFLSVYICKPLLTIQRKEDHHFLRSKPLLISSNASSPPSLSSRLLEIGRGEEGKRGGGEKARRKGRENLGFRNRREGGWKVVKLSGGRKKWSMNLTTLGFRGTAFVLSIILVRTLSLHQMIW